jgi:miniconductance mechanosensitive channel
MLIYFNQLFINFKIYPKISILLSYATVICIIILLSIFAYYITKKIFLKLLESFIKKTKAEWDDILIKENVFNRVSHIAPAILIFQFAATFPQYQASIQKFALTYMIIVTLFVFLSIFNSIESIYSSYPISKIRPIKGYIQIIKIFIMIIGIIIITGTIINQSPWQLITGIGAMTAFLLFVFKDPILGLIASIQFATNDMIHIGDWIQMPQYNADGDIVDISLTTIKVKNFDKTITTIPTYSLISDSFKNWRGVKETNARRVKRSIFIDVNSVKFCTPEMISKFENFDLISSYIKNNNNEIIKSNKNKTLKANMRGLTNIGVFRIYLIEYLKKNNNIRQDLTLLVRQLPSSEFGIPLEIYFFSKEINWAAYEKIQSDVFDFVFAIINDFDLKVFQYPSGNDLKKLNIK